jgi:transcriptional regulator with XRE-family HTH domain
MKKRIKQSSDDVLDDISRLSAEADWTEDEIDEALKEEGIDPEQLVHQVVSDIRKVFPGFPEQLSQEGPASSISRQARAKTASGKKGGSVKAQTQSSNSLAISSLFEAGEKRGLSKFDLADRLRLSIGIITKLNQRLIECSTVPVELIRELASTIGHSFDDVFEYLRCKPRLTPGLSFKADEAPELPEPQDFIEAVEKDRSLGPERKKELLNLAQKR